MNISMIVLNPFTHDARVAKEANTLQKSGHRVTVNALWAKGLPEQETSIEGYKIRRVRVKARERRLFPGAAWLEMLPKLISDIGFQHPDVIHAHDLNALIPASLAASRIKVKLIYDSHEFETGRDAESSRANRFKGWFWGQMERILIHRAQAVITVSPSIANALTNKYKIATPAIIRNCPESLPIPPRGILRAQLHIPPEMPIVLFQGVLGPDRGLIPLVYAIAQVPDCCLVLIGEGPLQRQIRQLAQETGLGDRLYEFKKVPLRELLNYTCDASLGTCLTENTCLNHFYSLPNKLFEYLMVGVPVLASNFPDMRSIVEQSNAGVVADPGNIAAIRDALQRALTNRVYLEQMSRNARQAAETRYNWEHEAQTLLSIYAQISMKKAF